MWNCTHFPHPTDKQLRHIDFSSSKKNFFELVVTRILHKQTPPLWNLISEVYNTGLILLEPSLDAWIIHARRYPLFYRAFSDNVTVALLVFQTSETTAMLVFLTNPVKVELCSYGNAFFCSSLFALMQAL